MRRFFITLLIDPHLSWERSPLPFMLSEASLICFLLRLGWISVDLGSFLSLGVFSLSFVISSGVLSLLLIGVPVDTGVVIFILSLQVWNHSKLDTIHLVFTSAV